jgi:hypothetical protein
VGRLNCICGEAKANVVYAAQNSCGPQSSGAGTLALPTGSQFIGKGAFNGSGYSGVIYELWETTTDIQAAPGGMQGYCAKALMRLR